MSLKYEPASEPLDISVNDVVPCTLHPKATSDGIRGSEILNF